MTAPTPKEAAEALAEEIGRAFGTMAQPAETVRAACREALAQAERRGAEEMREAEAIRLNILALLTDKPEGDEHG